MSHLWFYYNTHENKEQVNAMYWHKELLFTTKRLNHIWC